MTGEGRIIILNISYEFCHSGSQTSKIDAFSSAITMVTDTLDQLKLKEHEQSTSSYIYSMSLSIILYQCISC